MSNLATSEHVFPYLTDVAYATNLGSPTYVSITDIIEDTPPPTDVGESEDTQLQSAAATKEFGPGWATTGDFEFTTYAVGTQDRTLFGLLRTQLKWRITNPKLSTQSSSGDTAIFTGFIKSIKPSKGGTDSDDKLKIAYTIKPTGPITYAAGS